MKHYYSDPRSQNLIIRDTDTNEVVIIERIESVRVFVGGEVRLGDFKGPNGGETVEQMEDRAGGYRNHNYDAASGKALATHRRRATPEAEAAEGAGGPESGETDAGSDTAPSAIAKRVYELCDQGVTAPKEVAERLGINYAIAYYHIRNWKKTKANG